MRRREPDGLDAVIECVLVGLFWWFFVLAGLGWLWQWMTEEKQ